MCNVFVSAAGVEEVHGVSTAVTDASGSMETTSVTADDVHLAPSVGLVPNEILDDRNVSAEEGWKSQTSPSGMGDQAEMAAADYQEIREAEETEVEEPPETPGTPSSLPSLVSEPEDTCTPVKFFTVGYSSLVL